MYQVNDYNLITFIIIQKWKNNRDFQFLNLLHLNFKTPLKIIIAIIKQLKIKGGGGQYVVKIPMYSFKKICRQQMVSLLQTKFC